MRIICPMCLTDKYMKYINGSHIECGGHSHHSQELECHYCKGTIYATYECNENHELQEMEIHYKKEQEERSGTYA